MLVLKVGDTAVLTAQAMTRIHNGNRSINFYPCDSFVEKIAAYEGQTATVTHTFPPGYDLTIQFPDGQFFHAKTAWFDETPTENKYSDYEINRGYDIWGRSLPKGTNIGDLREPLDDLERFPTPSTLTRQNNERIAAERALANND